MTEHEREILEEIAGLRPARPWGAAVGAAYESLLGGGYITGPGELTHKGHAALSVPSADAEREGLIERLERSADYIEDMRGRLGALSILEEGALKLFRESIALLRSSPAAGVATACFECGGVLHGPYCPACREPDPRLAEREEEIEKMQKDNAAQISARNDFARDWKRAIERAERAEAALAKHEAEGWVLVPQTFVRTVGNYIRCSIDPNLTPFIKENGLTGSASPWRELLDQYKALPASPQPARNEGDIRAVAERARDFPNNTCPASRHVQLMAEALADGKPYPMLDEEPEHCAGSMLATVGALWNARSELDRLRADNERMREALEAVDILDDGSQTRIGITLPGNGTWVVPCPREMHHFVRVWLRMRRAALEGRSKP